MRTEQSNVKLDLPGFDTILVLNRRPTLLRFVRDKVTGVWDALDQLDDTPKASEEIVVGRAGNEYRFHVLRSPRRLSGWQTYCDYTVNPEQPTDHEARDTAAWREWCQRQLEKGTA